MKWAAFVGNWAREEQLTRTQVVRRLSRLLQSILQAEDSTLSAQTPKPYNP